MKIHQNKVVQCQKLGLIITIIQLLQLYFNYHRDQNKLYYLIPIIIWSCSKFCCTIISLVMNKKKNLQSYLKSILKTVILCEYISTFDEISQYTEKSLMVSIICQIYVYTLPNLLINNLIMYSNENASYQVFLEVMIVINLIFISLCNVIFLIHNKQIKVTKQTIFTILQHFLRYFIFSYLFIQLLATEQIIFFVWAAFHLFMTIHIASSMKKSNLRIEFFIAHLLQFDIYLLRKMIFNEIEEQIENKPKFEQQIQNMNNNQQNSTFEVTKWNEVLYLCMLQINILVFLSIKLLQNPIQIYLDYFIYFLLISITLQQVILTTQIFFKRMSVIINYNKTISWKYGKLKITTIMNNLSKNLIDEGFLFINIEDLRKSIYKINDQKQGKLTKKLQNYQGNNLFWINQRQFLDDLKEIKSGLNKCCLGKFQSLHLFFHDQSYNIQIIYCFNQNRKLNQKIILKPGYDELFVIQLLDFIQFISDSNLCALQVEADETQLIKLRLQSIRFQCDNIIQSQNYKKIISGVLSCNYQALAYYKNISNLIPLNPSLILYDLLEPLIN